MNKPKVSIIIPTYKRPNCLSRAVDSVLKQDYPNKEIVVVDDNEPSSQERKETQEVMNQYINNGIVTYLKHSTNRGGSAARNTGLSHISGKYVMFLDDDDEFLPGKINSQVECMEKLDSTWGCCYSKYERRVGDRIHSISGENREGDMLKEQLSRNFFAAGGSNLLIRTEVVKEVGGFDESFVRNQDMEFMVRIFKKYKIAYVDVLGLCCYEHQSKSKLRSYEEVTDHYLEMFSETINEMSTEDKKYIYEMINLQLYRYYIFEKKDVMSAIDLIIHKKISVLNSAKYILYMFNRKLKKVTIPYSF